MEATLLDVIVRLGRECGGIGVEHVALRWAHDAVRRRRWGHGGCGGDSGDAALDGGNVTNGGLLGAGDEEHDDDGDDKNSPHALTHGCTSYAGVLVDPDRRWGRAR